MNVLSVAAELYPLIKTGGLADVAGALPHALAAEGVNVTTLLPGYPAVLKAIGRGERVHRFDDFFGGEARLLAARHGPLELFVLDAPHLFRRDGTPYASTDGKEWVDNGVRFAALSRAGADVAGGLLERFRADVVHAHDWQAGLVPVYLRAARAPAASVFTIHNLAYQGKFDASILPSLGLPDDAYTVDGVEYYGTVGYLKAGIQFAGRITTVSPTYAAEILTDEGGMGLEGLLRRRVADLKGILNGVDDVVWNPATDPLLSANFDARNLGPRAANTRALQARLGLEPDARALVFGVVSRLTWQKGLDVLLDALPALLACGGQLALLGAGDADLERRFADAARQSPGRISCTFGYDEALAHQIQAGSAALLVPSRFEPCGLTQLCALRYGAIPIVARVGGLADTVIDANEMALAAGTGTGFAFVPVRKDALEHAIARAANAFADRGAWTRLRRNAMRTDVSWRAPARQYAQLYREVASASA